MPRTTRAPISLLLLAQRSPSQVRVTCRSASQHCCSISTMCSAAHEIQKPHQPFVHFGEGVDHLCTGVPEFDNGMRRHLIL